MDRRQFLAASTALPFVATHTEFAFAQTRHYAPASSEWRTFEVTTRLEIVFAGPDTKAWVPIPAISADWQQSLESKWSGNVRDATIYTDPTYGAKMVFATWADNEQSPVIEVVTRVRARDRSVDWGKTVAPVASTSELALNLKATDLIATDGIVAATAAKVTAGKSTDLDKVRALYDWMVLNTYREPSVRGCGVGDIKSMLETGNLGGECADLNALFVGLCRTSGIPARDIYGIRVAKSAFGYKELGAGNSDITKAQHCRAEVWLKDYGWVATDPADVAKVMRQETATWIKDPRDAIVAPVYGALFGAWEANWMGYNDAHDIALPGTKGTRVAFLMYPQAESRGERVDSLDPDTFKYRITAREVAG